MRRRRRHVVAATMTRAPLAHAADRFAAAASVDMSAHAAASWRVNRLALQRRLITPARCALIT